MKKSELKQLIREVVEEVKNDIYDVQVYLPNKKDAEMIVSFYGRTRNGLIRTVREYLYKDGPVFQLRQMHPELYDGRYPRRDLIFKIAKQNASPEIEKIKMQIGELQIEASYLSYENPKYKEKRRQIEDLQKKLKKLKQQNGKIVNL